MPIVLRPPTEPVSLTEQLGGLGRTRRRVSVATGAFALVAVALAGAGLTCLLDITLTLSPLARGFGLALTLVGCGLCWLRIREAAGLPATPLGVALELEERHPRLNDALASAVAFMGDTPAAKNRFAAESIRKAEKLTHRLNLKTFVPAMRCWQAFWAFAAVGVIVLAVGLWHAPKVPTAVVRFLDPFGVHPWPTKTQIALVAPQTLPARLPKGDAFDLHFVVRGEIPDRAVVSVRLNGGGEFEEEFPLSAGNDPKQPGAAVVSTKLDASRVQGNFTFRVRANDADTGWNGVSVIPPPKLVPLNGRPSPQLHVVPPEYTGLTPADLPDGTGVVEVPTGSRVTLRAATDVPVATAALVFQGDRSAYDRAPPLAPLGHLHPWAAVGGQLLGETGGRDIPVSLSTDGRVLGAEFTPVLSGMYALRLADETGLTGTRLIEVRVMPDPVPLVSLVRPVPGRDPSVMTPDAKVAVAVVAEDKVYALRRAFLEYRVGRDGPVRTIPLFDAQRTGELMPSVAGGVAVTIRPHPTAFETELTLPLSAFRRDDGTPLREGDTLFVRAAADDWDDVTLLKPPGRSAEFEIRVSSRDAVEAFLQKELAALHPELLRAREQQREAQQKTQAAAPQPDGTLSPEDREKLLTAEQIQRQLRGRVADSRDGLRSRADLLRQTARASNLPRSNTTSRVDDLATELGRLADRDLAAIEPLIAEARQQSTVPSKDEKEKPVAGLLSRAERHQKAVEESLTNILDLLSQWGGAGQVRGEARVLRDGVNREGATTEKLPEKVPPGKAPNALTPQQRADLEKLAGRIDVLAESAGQLLGRAGKFAAEKDKAAADAKAAAVAKEQEAAELRKKAATAPPGSDDERQARERAAALRGEADDLNRAAERSAEEAAALRRAQQAAGGESLPRDLRNAADAVRNNQSGQAVTNEKSAADRLDRLAEALTEKADESVPELKKFKKAADELDALAAAQDDLNKKIDAAARIADPEKRDAELKRLAREQQKLIDKDKELVQRLTRERADAAARDVRQAGDRMEATRDDLEQGRTPNRTQDEAVEKLDDARDRLDAAQQPPARELSDEKRRKLFDQVKALLDRQRGATAEATRVQEKVLKVMKWERSLLASYGDLEDRERALAVEVRNLSDREFGDLPVFGRMLMDSADGMEKAADRAKDRRQDALDADPGLAFDPDLEKANDARVRRPMDTAQRRLEQLLDAVKPDEPKKETAKGGKKDGAPKKAAGGQPPKGGGGGDEEVVPPLAQLKALRALQAELNERTAAFAKSHPDTASLEPAQREELKELEDAQREISELFEKMSRMFQKNAEEGKP